MSDSFSSIDHQHMAQALRLAAQGLYTTQPNPRVGCVIATGEQLLGRGWHQRVGGPHAEVHALREAGARARGATAYVTLEPCAHHGRTPPCADALIAAGVARVVIAAEDPFPQVAGRGIGKLRAAGIEVQSGLLREQARELNLGFFSRIERARPFVRLKLAMSLDGRTALANGRSQWITGSAARADVQHWRARSSAILAGSGTVLADDPQLNVRLPAGIEHTQPLRVVLDRQLRVPATARVRDGSSSSLLLHDPALPSPAASAGVDYAPAALDGAGRFELAALLAQLAARDISELHVEAGAKLGGALLAAGLVDELLLYIAPILLGDAAQPLLRLPTLHEMSERWQLRCVEQRSLGEDWRLRLRPTA